MRVLVIPISRGKRVGAMGTGVDDAVAVLVGLGGAALRAKRLYRSGGNISERVGLFGRDNREFVLIGTDKIVSSRA